MCAVRTTRSSSPMNSLIDHQSTSFRPLYFPFPSYVPVVHLRQCLGSPVILVFHSKSEIYVKGLLAGCTFSPVRLSGPRISHRRLNFLVDGHPLIRCATVTVESGFNLMSAPLPPYPRDIPTLGTRDFVVASAGISLYSGRPRPPA